MSIADLINGSFEAFGGVALWGNVRRLARDKQVRGLDWRSTVFFTSWGYWNCFYYPSLHQWLSFIGGIAIVSANTVWVALAIKYRGR